MAHTELDTTLDNAQDVIGELMKALRRQMDQARQQRDFVLLFASQKLYTDCQLVLGNTIRRILKPVQPELIRQLQEVTKSIRDRTKHDDAHRR